ncbi:hypothetical protein [Pseudomonas sp. OV546]|uniref:hypothetical protein n=1 Tax=Pseudomonas sp. OV546 TaxID=1881063 RepID=UPI0008ED2B04|nr:hypothetical protein [Pseudomonas sp. OV546]SFV10229.1 hypothetical protein SAMN05428951_1152 [Pseudomonas sp. OV546]
MNTVLIKEVGISLWNQLYSTKECEFSTISLLNQDFKSVWNTWCELASSLTAEWPTIITWYTLGFPHENKTQEYLTLKEHSKHSAPNDILKKNETTSIYSGIEHLNSKPDQIDPSTLTSYRYCVTLMQKENSNLENLWQRLKHLDHLSKTDDFKLILSDRSSLAFSFFDAETHGVAQLICHSEHLPYLNETLQKMNLEEIQQDGVYAYIHR